MGIMRILFTNYEYPPLGGGGGVVNAWLAEELAKKHDVTVLTSQAPDIPKERIEKGVRVIRVPVMGRDQKAVASMASMASYIPNAIREGRKLLRREKFDIINTHFVVPTGPVGDALSRFANIPNVLSLHGGDVYDPSKFTSPHRHMPLRMSVRWLLNRADVVVGQSKNTINNMRVFYTHQVYAVRIPLGIPRPGDFGVADRATYGLSDDETVFVTLGRLVARKNISELIQVMGALKDKKAKLLIMGTGPLREELEAQARSLGIAEQIKFLGFVEEEEKLRILRMADAFVSTSHHEGFGLVFLEAMACGLPVVCYNYGGQTDFLDDDVTGHVVPLGSTQRFIKAMLDLVENPDKSKKMGELNLERVKTYFIEQCAHSYESLFEETLEAYKKPQTVTSFVPAAG
jgi:glycosyltransferase involved in cell wall biosynthesis